VTETSVSRIDNVLLLSSDRHKVTDIARLYPLHSVNMHKQHTYLRNALADIKLQQTSRFCDWHSKISVHL